MLRVQDEAISDGLKRDGARWSGSERGRLHPGVKGMPRTAAEAQGTLLKSLNGDNSHDHNCAHTIPKGNLRPQSTANNRAARIASSDYRKP